MPTRKRFASTMLARSPRFPAFARSFAISPTHGGSTASAIASGRHLHLLSCPNSVIAWSPVHTIFPVRRNPLFHSFPSRTQTLFGHEGRDHFCR